MEGHSLDHMKRYPEIFCCPGCGGEVAVEEQVRCIKCNATFPVEDDIPLMFVPNEWEPSKPDVTHLVRSFYEKTPFPNYNGFEKIDDLVRGAERSVFARILNDQLPFDARVLEVGCGTGQLANYLGIAHR